MTLHDIIKDALISETYDGLVTYPEAAERWAEGKTREIVKRLQTAQATNFDVEHVVIGAHPSGATVGGRPKFIEETYTDAAQVFRADHDVLLVLVPAGTWVEAREKLWSGLETRPVLPENVGPHGAQDGMYIKRLYGAL